LVLAFPAAGGFAAVGVVDDGPADATALVELAHAEAPNPAAPRTRAAKRCAINRDDERRRDNVDTISL